VNPMNNRGKRIVGVILLLLGLSFLAIGLHMGQLEILMNLLEKVFP